MVGRLRSILRFVKDYIRQLWTVGIGAFFGAFGLGAVLLDNHRWLGYAMLALAGVLFILSVLFCYFDFRMVQRREREDQNTSGVGPPG